MSCEKLNSLFIVEKVEFSAYELLNSLPIVLLCSIILLYANV